MFKRILSSIGIGSAKVDLVLPQDTYRAGETINGHLQISGGITGQTVNQIYIQLTVDSKFKLDDNVKHVTKPLDQALLAQGLQINENDNLEMPVSYTLPENIPVTTPSTRLYLLTGMDISSAVDPKDHDPINVVPGARQEVVMRALEQELGFRRKRNTGAFNGRHQEFEYLPGSFMRGRLDELEVVFHFRGDGIGLLMQIDKKSGGFLGGFFDELDLDERNVSCYLPNSQLTNPREVAYLLKEFIEREYRKIV